MIENQKIILSWYSDTIQKLDTDKYSDPVDKLCCSVIKAAEDYTKALFKLCRKRICQQKHIMPARAFIRVLTELLSKFLWVIVKRDEEHEGQKEIRLKRWIYDNQIENKKHLEDAKEAYREDEDSLSFCEEQLSLIQKDLSTLKGEGVTKRLPQTKQILEELREFGKNLTVLFYNPYNEAIHLDPKSLLYYLNGTDDDGYIKDITCKCLILSYNFNLFVRKHFDVNTTEMEDEFNNLIE